MIAIKQSKGPTLKELEARTGGLSKPSKMPCFSWSTSAKDCNVGSAMRGVAGSTCEDCYAYKRGNYLRYEKAIDAAHNRRMAAMLADPEEWAAAMVELIRRREKSGFFRWHDAGDLAGRDHLHAINRIAWELPEISFWLPTREYKLVRAYMKENKIAPNLIIRFSALFKGQPGPDKVARDLGINTSTVGLPGASHVCPAVASGSGKCGDCRNCWDRSIHNIDYPLH